MEILFSVENFEDADGTFRELNSPRTLEACLRAGLDPSELYPKPRKKFVSKKLNEEMIDTKYNLFEKKRKDKKEIVKDERAKIIEYAQKKSGRTSENLVGAASSPPKADKAGLIELEEKRMEALRNRQQAELAKIVEREQTMAALQLKIARAEEEAHKKEKLHAKKVAEQKLIEEKKRLKIEQEKKQKEKEEADARKELMKKEAAVAEKLAKQRLAMERQIAKEARQNEEERKAKMAAYAEKTAALLKAHEDLAEQNRLKMLERERVVQEQLQNKKLKKAQEVQESREKAAQLIQAAMEAHHARHEEKRRLFQERQMEAEKRERELKEAEKANLRKQAEAIERKNKLRLTRLIESYNGRMEHRERIIQRRREKDNCYDKIEQERNEQIALLKFTTELKLNDKLENVERQARVNEFKRLQTLRKIEQEDKKYDEIQENKRAMALSHASEAKQALTRKHEIADTMQRMRATNDFTLLDKLFATKRSDQGTRGRTAGGTVKGGLGDEPETGDDKLNQTV